MENIEKKIGVIVPTHNRKNYLKAILVCISDQKIENVILEIIVVVDGSTDGTFEMLATDYPNIHVIIGTGNWWWTKCMNEGFKKAIEIESDFVLVMNDDVEIKSDYLQTLWRDYSTISTGAILGSASVSIEKPHKIESAGSKEFFKSRLKFVNYYPGFSDFDENFFGIQPTFNLSGRGTLIPVQIFEKIGYYDERFVQYGSDDEFSLRAKLSGIPVFISWNALIYNHTMLTAKGRAFNQNSLISLLLSFFNPYSANSLRKTAYFYIKWSYKMLLPIYVAYVFLGTFKAYFLNYRK